MPAPAMSVNPSGTCCTMYASNPFGVRYVESSRRISQADPARCSSHAPPMDTPTMPPPSPVSAPSSPAADAQRNVMAVNTKTVIV